jgi:hypothetical protein
MIGRRRFICLKRGGRLKGKIRRDNVIDLKFFLVIEKKKVRF